MRSARSARSARSWIPWIPLALLLNATGLAQAHAPTHDGDCPANCCAPKDGDHTSSQAFYLKGDGGVEVHLDDIDIEGGEIIHWDVVFRGDYQERPLVSDFELYVGCGGCAPNDAYVEESKLEPTKVLTPVIEPFTQTSYYPLYKKDDPIRKFDSSRLADCPKQEDGSRHFTVRLKTLSSAATPIHWAPVLGCAEFECEVDAFGISDIFMFPYYILHNQRGAWSEYYEGLLYAVIVATCTMLLLVACPRSCCQVSTFCCAVCGDECGEAKGCRDLCGPHRNTNPYESPTSERVCEMIGWPGRTMFTRVVDHYWRRAAPSPGLLQGTASKEYVYVRQFSPRGLLYFIAVWSIFVSLFNGIFNIAYSVRRLDPPYEYESNGMAMYIWIIVVWGHVAPLILVSIIWWKATNVPESRWRRFFYGGAPDDKCTSTGCCTGPCVNNFVNCRSPFWAHGCWWFVELFGVGIAGFFWLGTGLWVCSGAIVLASLWRCFWTYCSGRWWSQMPEPQRGDEEAARIVAPAPRALLRRESSVDNTREASQTGPPVYLTMPAKTQPAEPQRSSVNSAWV